MLQYIALKVGESGNTAVRLQGVRLGDMGTTAKDERLALRLTRSQRKALEAAATATGSTLTEFSVAAILARAEDVLGSRAVFEVDEQVWSEFVNALDQPVTSDRFAALIARPPVWDE